MFSLDDHAFMSRALRLAERGLFTATPNPRVGCVLVKDGKIVGEGWHERAGEPHAEVYALRDAGEAARGAAAYVTLEPCSHHGRTPPCANALIAAGVARVVAALRDPNPEVAGRGLARLAEAGVKVDCGLLEEEARELNIGFISRMERCRPWVRLKAAGSLDGKSALKNGESQWITGAPAREDGHRWRARACVLLTGYATVREDDPRLTVRGVDTPRQPVKVVLDSRLELSPQAQVLNGPASTLIITASTDEKRAAPLRERGAEILVLPDEGGRRVDLHALLRELARRGMNEVHVEAGARLNGALLAADLVDELLLYLAPCLIGHAARGLFDLPELQTLAARKRLALRDLRLIGGDLRLVARPRHARGGPRGICYD